MMVRCVPVPQGICPLLNKLHDKFGKEMQTIKGGTQVDLPQDFPVIRDLVDNIRPLFEPLSVKGLWSIRMNKGGYHVKHNHPEGNISGVCYVQVGSGADLEVGNDIVRPSEGMVVLFPSETPHGTTVYEGEKPRLTVAFDLK